MARCEGVRRGLEEMGSAKRVKWRRIAASRYGVCAIGKNGRDWKWRRSMKRGRSKREDEGGWIERRRNQSES